MGLTVEIDSAVFEPSGLNIGGRLATVANIDSLKINIFGMETMLVSRDAALNKSGPLSHFNFFLGWDVLADILYLPKLFFFAESNGENVAVTLGGEVFFNFDWHSDSFFIDKIRSPGARIKNQSVQNFFAWHFLNQNWDSNEEISASALIVIIYRLLDKDHSDSAEAEAKFLLYLGQLISKRDKLNINTRWGFSLQTALFYLEFKCFDKRAAVNRLANNLDCLDDTCSLDSYPNIFKLTFVLSAISLIELNDKRIESLLMILNRYLAKDILWKISPNFFASLDKKNMVSNYHEIFKMLMLLRPEEYNLDWVGPENRKIETRFIGDPGKQIVQNLFSINKIDYR